jgi:gliding motility-associated-like protein
MKTFTRYAILALVLGLSNTLLAQPTANFTATPVVGCAPLLVNFTSTSTGNPTSYSWNLGNSATSVLPNPSTTYTIPGTYTVTLTVTNTSGSNTKTMTNYITVLGAPIVSFTANDTSGCPPHTVIFSNTTNPVTPGAATYSWSFGDGNISTLQNPTHTYPPPGYYNVTLIATNSGGCVSSLAKPNYIHVYTPPVADFSAPTSQCNYPATVTFTPTVVGSGPFTYAWTYGDGGIGTGGNPSHTYLNPGQYTVTMIVTDVNGCMDTVVKPSYISVGSLAAGFTTIPSSGCVNTPFQFSNQSLNAQTYLWDFGDGNTDVTPNPTHVYAAAGLYSVKLKVSNGTCSDSVTQTVNIYPQPVPNFSFTPVQPCPPPAPIQFTNLSTGATSYLWSFGDGGTSTQANPLHTYTSQGWFTAQLIATSSFGCSDTISYADTVKVYNQQLLLTATPTSGCLPLTVKFKVSNRTHTPYPTPPFFLNYPYPIVTWFWDFGDGGTSTLDSPAHIYTVPGIYNVHCTVTTSNGCTFTDSITVMGGFKPTASFTEAPDTICIHNTVYFTNTSTNLYPYTTYTWSFGDTMLQWPYWGASNAPNPQYTYDSISGHFTITLVVNNYGCTDTMIKYKQVLVRPPTAFWTAKFSCDTPLKVRFFDTTSLQPTSHMWYFGDGTTSSAANPVHTYPALGTYTVTLVAYNSTYGCVDTTIHIIDLMDPVLAFTTPDTAICRGDSIVFSPTYSIAPINPYTWMINGQYPFPYLPLDQSIGAWGYRFNQNGIYKIQVIQKDPHGCLDTATRSNYILVAKPTAAFTAVPTVGCVPLYVTFTENSTNTTGAYSVFRDWIFGNGNTASVNTATTNSTYNFANLYNVQMIVTDNVGCKDTLLKPNYIDARQPVASFAADDTAACPGQNISFLNYSSGTALSAYWTFGDGTTSTVFNPVHAYSQTGTYTVKLRVTDPSGCKDSITKVTYITISKPNAVFTMSDTLGICPPLNVLFTNLTTGATSYAWDLGNTTTSSLQNPSVIYTTPGIYPIVLIATNSEGCTDTAYGQANLLGYAGGLTYTPLEGCAPLTVQFTSTLTNVPSIIWDFRDGVTQPANGLSTTSHTYVTPGAYVPQLILSNGLGCLNSSSGLDTIKVDDVLAGFITSPPCVKTPIQFQDTSFSFFSPVTSWYWSFSNGQSTSTINNPINFYNAPGSYPVYLIATNAHGCSDTTEKNITIFPLPVITAGLDTIICPGDAAQLNALGGVSYVWTPATNLSCSNCQATLASPVTPTNFIVAGTDINGCVNTDTVRVNMQYVTTSAVGNGGDICDDSTFQLLASGAQHYEWRPSESLSANNIANPLASPHTTTIYTVTAWEGSCPPDSHTVKVVVYPLPTIYAGSDETIVAGTSVMLIASGLHIAGFTWSPAASLTCETCANPVASPKQTTNYIVLATSPFGCKSIDTVTVHVLCDKSQLFIPNSFSPNGDGQNEVFYPRGEGLKKITSFRVYNRWGSVVFERASIDLNDPLAGWDGTFKGQVQGPDVYVYVVDGICESGEAISWKGDVTLIR